MTLISLSSVSVAVCNSKNDNWLDDIVYLLNRLSRLERLSWEG
jgi:hypothetical protein